MQDKDNAKDKDQGKATDKFGASYWTGDAPLRCVATCDETSDVRSFFFRPHTPPDQPQQFAYMPGQFITLELDIKGQRICRCYTLSSSPCRPYVASITVKRQPGGIVSNYLHDNLSAGMEIYALPAAGDFSYITEDEAEKYLFLSGGSGITPLMSMSRYIYDMRTDYDVVFVHSARTPTDIIFYEELESIEKSMDYFKLSLFCDGIGDSKEWQGAVGFITAESLLATVPDFLERKVFCCGPPAYMQNIRSILQESNFNMKQYHEESFNFGENAEDILEQQEVEAAASEGSIEPELPLEIASGISAAEPIESNEEAFKVYFKGLDKRIECPADSTILEAARDQGVQRAFMCSQGICGTCKSKLISGQVDMQHNGGIRESEIEEGYFLPCCSFPLSDITME